MNDVDLANYAEIKRWCREMLQKPRVAGAGKANLSRLLIEQLERCRNIDAVPPEELIALIARQLDVDGRVRNEPRLKREQLAVAAALACDPNVSDNKLSRDCGVSRPTIALWKKQPWLRRYRELFESDPNNLRLLVSQIAFADFQKHEANAGLLKEK